MIGQVIHEFLGGIPVWLGKISRIYRVILNDIYKVYRHLLINFYKIICILHGIIYPLE